MVFRLAFLCATCLNDAVTAAGFSKPAPGICVENMSATRLLYASKKTGQRETHRFSIRWLR
jgi:hypothetical protein